MLPKFIFKHEVGPDKPLTCWLRTRVFCRNRENLPPPIQRQLSEKLKTFCNFSLHF